MCPWRCSKALNFLGQKLHLCKMRSPHFLIGDVDFVGEAAFGFVVVVVVVVVVAVVWCECLE